jgi:serine/threonine protein kinase
MREAQLYYDLTEYEYIVKYYDCFFDDSNYFYLVLDYCVSSEIFNHI